MPNRAHRAAALAVALVSGAAIGAPEARGAATCTFDGAGGVHVETTGGDNTIISRTFGTAGGQDKIEVDGKPCADVPLVDFIDVDDISVAGATTITISLETGDFQGGVDEPGESDDIEIVLDLGAGSDKLRIKGSYVADRFRFGSNGETLHVNLNAGEADHVDHDLTLGGVDGSVDVRDLGGWDVIRGDGGRRTGSSRFPMRLVVKSGDGDDLLIGGTAGDFLSGERRNDAIRGGGGADTIRGGDGPDRLFGQRGPDDIFGNLGADRLEGGPGGDSLDGGGGDDRCIGGPGADQRVMCERA